MASAITENYNLSVRNINENNERLSPVNKKSTDPSLGKRNMNVLSSQKARCLNVSEAICLSKDMSKSKLEIPLVTHIHTLAF
jgi:hypothetical protein